MISLGTIFTSCLLLINSCAVLDERRFLSKYGLSNIDIEGINNGSVKSQVSEFLRMCRLMRVPLIFVNSLSILFSFLSMILKEYNSETSGRTLKSAPSESRRYSTLSSLQL
eukprot:maker-scaffold_25-snap-gene-5.57-mRNA-1 protein AED:0.05 eAED:0.12 QI:0/0/0.33/1/0/0/3/409/110